MIPSPVIIIRGTVGVNPSTIIIPAIFPMVIIVPLVLPTVMFGNPVSPTACTLSPIIPRIPLIVSVTPPIMVSAMMSPRAVIPMVIVRVRTTGATIATTAITVSLGLTLTGGSRRDSVFEPSLAS